METQHGGATQPAQQVRASAHGLNSKNNLVCSDRLRGAHIYEVRGIVVDDQARAPHAVDRGLELPAKGVEIAEASGLPVSDNAEVIQRDPARLFQPAASWRSPKAPPHCFMPSPAVRNPSVVAHPV